MVAIGVTASERKKNSDSTALDFIILFSVMEEIFNLLGLQASRRRLRRHHRIYTNSLNLLGIYIYIIIKLTFLSPQAAM